MALKARTYPELVRPLAEVEKEAVESALILCGGNALDAAKALQVSRATMYRWVQRFRQEDETG